jgi:hypothetical protein
MCPIIPCKKELRYSVLKTEQTSCTHFGPLGLHWTQNIFEPGLRHSKRGREGGNTTPFAIASPPRTSAGWPPPCLFVTVNEAQRYLATSLLDISSLEPRYNANKQLEDVLFRQITKQYLMSTTNQKISDCNQSQQCLLPVTVVGANLCVWGPLELKGKGIRGVEGAADREHFLPVLWTFFPSGSTL